MTGHPAQARAQDMRPAVLSHLTDTHGLALCDDMTPGDGSSLPPRTLRQLCPACHLISIGRLVKR
jgi:hypothetical protein